MKSPTEPSVTLGDKLIGLIESVKPSDKLLLRLAFFVFIFSGIWLALVINDQYSENTPTQGGSISEGILGTPRYVNPALAITRADQDVVALVYSSLMKISTDGRLINEVAEEINLSEDGLTYNIKLRKDVRFHDGTPLTTRDVVYTIGLIQDPDLKSPLRGNWTDVMIEQIDEYELNIVLEDAYTPFIENFTFGILPAHAWSSLPTEQIPFSQLNTEPIGSGPFRIVKVERSESGLVKKYTMEAFPNMNVSPNVAEVDLVFFEKEDELITALNEEVVQATTYVPQSKLANSIFIPHQLIEEPLPRTFGVFFNQNKSTALLDEGVREALTVVLDNTELIEKAFYGYGVPMIGPTPFTELELESEDDNNVATSTTQLEKAKEILSDAGWTQNDLGLWTKGDDDEEIVLTLTLRTSNAPLFDSLSSLIADKWEDLGVQVTVEQFEQAGLVQSVIRPRDFQVLLFGHDLSRSYDLYPIWHSSQQDDPGLNVSQYTNVSVDALLEEARTEKTEEARMTALKEASQIIATERPAIFLAQPTLTYVVSTDITVADMNNLGKPADRFSNIEEWHTESDSLWSVFRNTME